MRSETAHRPLEVNINDAADGGVQECRNWRSCANNLLTVVLANLELLGKYTRDDPEVERLLKIAMEGAQRGASLTQRLLAFAHRQDLNVQPRNLTDLIRGMMALIERSVGSAIELDVDLPPTLPLVLVDANQIELALLNLVVNARDAMPQGGRLSIRLDCASGGQR